MTHVATRRPPATGVDSHPIAQNIFQRARRSAQEQQGYCFGKSARGQEKCAGFEEIAVCHAAGRQDLSTPSITWRNWFFPHERLEGRGHHACLASEMATAVTVDDTVRIFVATELSRAVEHESHRHHQQRLFDDYQGYCVICSRQLQPVVVMRGRCRQEFARLSAQRRANAAGESTSAREQPLRSTAYSTFPGASYRYARARRHAQPTQSPMLLRRRAADHEAITRCQPHHCSVNDVIGNRPHPDSSHEPEWGGGNSRLRHLARAKRRHFRIARDRREGAQAGLPPAEGSKGCSLSEARLRL